MSKKTRTHSVELSPYDRAYSQLMSDKETSRFIRRMDEYQRAYYEGTKKNRISIVNAKAGTGKTQVAFASGIEELRKGANIQRLIYARFTDDTQSSLGFLPGEFDDKQFTYFIPAYETLEECGIQRAAVDIFRDRDEIRFCTEVALRGTTIKNSFIIIDEAQNARTIKDLKTILTRIHISNTVVLIGHSGQQDNKKVQRIGKFIPFEVYTIHLLKKQWTQQYELKVDYRGEICKWSDEIDQTIAEIESGKW